MTMADRPFAVPRPADRSSSLKSPANEYRGARRRRAQTLLLTFGLFAAAFAVILILRVAVPLPTFHH